MSIRATLTQTLTFSLDGPTVQSSDSFNKSVTTYSEFSPETYSVPGLQTVSVNFGLVTTPKSVHISTNIPLTVRLNGTINVPVTDFFVANLDGITSIDLINSTGSEATAITYLFGS